MLFLWCWRCSGRSWLLPSFFTVHAQGTTSS